MSSLRKLLKEIIPKLSLLKHKGQDGRLCVIGGSLEYTGAPYFTGRSALRCGADLVHIICDKQASTAIKSYCPELMVAPYLDCTSQTIMNDLDMFMKQSLPRMHSIIAGPGLGRNENIMQSTSSIITQSLKHKIPMVLDGDALWLLSQVKYRDVLKANIHSNVILTPNAMEFRRLWINYILQKDVSVELKRKENEYIPPFDTLDLLENVKEKEQKTDDNEDETLKCDEVLLCKDFENIQHIKDTALLANTLGGITILRKGAVDIITNGNVFILIGEPYSLRRCGGQGDILCGIIGLWLYWSNVYFKDRKQDENANQSTCIAAYAGSYLMRKIAVEAFSKFKRSTLTNDMIECIPVVVDHEFPVISSL
eukprot:1010955_1